MRGEKTLNQKNYKKKEGTHKSQKSLTLRVDDDNNNDRRRVGDEIKPIFFGLPVGAIFICWRMMMMMMTTMVVWFVMSFVWQKQKIPEEQEKKTPDVIKTVVCACLAECEETE